MMGWWKGRREWTCSIPLLAEEGWPTASGLAAGVVSSAQSLLREGMRERHRSALFNARKKKIDRRTLRKCSTAAEAVLWTYLKNRKLLGKKFRRQSSVGPYIVDFYCAECRLVIELDGAPHFGPNAGEYDQQRTEYLKQAGLRVLRFENKAVKENIEFVLEMIKRSLQPN
jgi:very-short-patch-repair endonuclease